MISAAARCTPEPMGLEDQDAVLRYFELHEGVP